VPGNVHDTENVGAMMQRRGDKAGPKAMTREYSWIETCSFCSLLEDLGYESVCEKKERARRAKPTLPDGHWRQ
jgi:hypothetical protein